MNGSSPRDTRTAGLSDAGSAPSKAKLWRYCKADHWAAIVIDSPGFSIWGNDALEIYICEEQSSTHVVCSTDCSLLKSSLGCFSTTGKKNIKLDLPEWVILRATLWRLTTIWSTAAFQQFPKSKKYNWVFFLSSCLYPLSKPELKYQILNNCLKPQSDNTAISLAHSISRG